MSFKFKVGDIVRWDWQGSWFLGRVNRLRTDIFEDGDNRYVLTLVDRGSGDIYDEQDLFHAFDSIHVQESYLQMHTPSVGGLAARIAEDLKVKECGPSSPCTFLDRIGNVVRVGDSVAYSTTRGLRIASVETVKWNQKMYGGYFDIMVKPYDPPLRSTQIYRDDVVKVGL